jgi:prepilin-type N-terminal cleavage/methylation domain-containing protein
MNHKGFTLIELVIVIVLIGIIAVFAAPRLGNISSTKAAAFADKLRADIRYAQSLAMTRNQRYRVYFNNTNPPGPPVPAIPANGYGVVYDTSVAQNWSSTAYANDPAGEANLRVDLSTGDYMGITLASAPNPIEFNSLGVSTAATVTINPGGYQITITAQTGAVN